MTTELSGIGLARPDLVSARERAKENGATRRGGLVDVVVSLRAVRVRLKHSAGGSVRWSSAGRRYACGLRDRAMVATIRRGRCRTAWSYNLKCQPAMLTGRPRFRSFIAWSTT